MKAVPIVLMFLILLLAGLTLVRTVEASTTTSWTSTADFDSGDKGLVDVPGSWSFQDVYPTVYGPSAIAYNGFAYTFGGYDVGTPPVANGVRDANTYRYTPTSHTWAQLTDMPANRSDMSSAVWADRIYVLGGQLDSGVATKSVDYYNVTADTWTHVYNASPDIHEGSHAVTYNNLIYFTGGSSVFKFNPSTGVETAIACSITSGIGATHGVVGAYWYFLGGASDTTNKVRRFSFADETCDNNYDTSPFESSRNEGAWQTPVVSGNIYMMIGWKSPGTFYRTVYRYEPIGKTWTTMQSANLARTAHGVAVLGSVIYIFGGMPSQASDAGGAVRIVDAFNTAGTSHDGHNQIETVTDSRSAVAGSFQLATGMSDSFYRTDYVGNPIFWTPKNNDPYGACNYSITSGGNASVVDIDIRAKYPHGCALQTAFAIAADFNVSANLTMWGTGTSAGFGAFGMLNERGVYPSWGATIDGGFILLNSIGQLIAYKVLNGVLTACGSTNNGNGAWKYVAISGVGTTWTFYKSFDGSSWTQTQTCTNSVTGPFYAELMNSGGNTWLGGEAIRDFHVSAGTGGAGSYRSSGAWVSPLQTYASVGYVSYINLTFSAVTSTYKIDRVRVLDSADLAIYTNNTDITTGTSESITLSFNASLLVDWKIEILLAGDGVGTPILESVSIFSVEALVASIATSNPVTGDSPLTVDFYGSYTGGIGPYNLSWDFGDGTMAAYGTHVTHTFQTGTYTVTLTVTDSAGATDTDTITVNTSSVWVLWIGFILFGILCLFGLKVPLLWTIAGFVLIFLGSTVIYTLTGSPWIASVTITTGVLIMLTGGIYTMREPSGGGYGA